MNVAEESDSGVSPMNHSNKVEQLMAESEEGRALIKENLHQTSTRPTQSGTRVSQGWRVCGKLQGIPWYRQDHCPIDLSRDFWRNHNSRPTLQPGTKFSNVMLECKIGDEKQRRALRRVGLVCFYRR